MRTRKTPASNRVHIGYVRVSGYDQSKHGVSLESQEASLRADAMMRGVVLDEIIHDDGRSGSTVEHRPGMSRVLAMVARGEVASLSLFKLDRGFRSVGDMSNAVKLFEKHSVAFVSVSEKLDTSTAVGRMMLNMLASFAEFERDLAGERTAENLGRLRSEGRVYSKVTPYGYRAEGKSLVRDAATYSVLERVQAMTAEGCGPTAIARALNADGVPSPGGSTWFASSVASVLRTASRAS